ncbi:ArsR family transcriptional regulator [Bacteroidetes/Chlorobi group bacterium ChocPot_Mid]|jgi:DNA-binding transcriptional ArsR family regulator|nr:MAG: ArsR family transcriptional regulator [Bacteroidetes/Chlorobi group bacterium ChocPot_Mid]
MDDLFKALDDESRRKILELLKDGDLTAGEIAEHFKMTKPSISYHLELLRRGELVVSTKKGQFVYYSLNTNVLDKVVRWLFKITKSKIISEKNI